jgi:hypothetical protein
MSWLALAACGGPELRGVVQSMPSSDAHGRVVAGRPIARARVDLVCGPGYRILRTFTTDSAGKLAAELEDAVPNGCWFAVSRAGFVSRRIRVLDACAVGRASRCEAMGLSARLVPEPAP